MDRGIKKQEKRGAKKSHHKYEKKKEMGANSHIVEDSETHTVKESCANTTDRMVHSEDRTSDDAGSSFEPSEADQDDSTITSNYNTISSLAALKELLQGECGDSMETDSFFQHYFMKHCNTLPSRDSNSPFPLPERRRLSECREEDEEEERKESNPLPSTANSASCSEATSQSNLNTALRDVSSSDGSADPLGRDSGLSRASLSAGTGSAEWEPAASITATSSHNSLTKEQPLNRTVMGEKHKFLVTRAPTQLEKVLRPQAQNAHTVHFGTKGAEELRPSVRSIFTGQNFHRDKKYFDSDLIEIRSSADSVITCDAEDIWVKRAELRPKVRRAEAARSDPYEEDGSEVGRPRAGTWGAQSREDDAIKEKNLKKEKDTPVKKDNDEKKRRKDEPKLDAAISKSTPQSMGQPCSSSQERRGTEDDQTHPMYQQTIHGTSGVSRRPALLDSFRGKKTDSKKHPSFMKQIRSAVQNMGHGSRPQSSIAGPRESPSTHSNSREGSAIKAPGQKGNSRDGSAHQLSASDKTYYHTVMAESRRPGPIAKVMDIFRSRQPDQDAASKRRARALAQQKQLAVGGANLRRKGQEADARRSSFGALLATRHRAADLSLDPHHAAMLFRDARGLPVADPFLEKVTLSDLEEDESQIFVKFFKFHKCYDLIPTSAKLVVFDTQLLVKKAFFALVYNGVRAAPLWDSAKQDFVGMLTITDFIKILQMYYTSPNIPMDQLEEHKLDTWRRVLAGSVKPLVSITPDSSLYDAIKMLISNRIHRLPLIDLETGNVLYILTHKRILRFLFLYINELPKPSYLHCKVRDLNMGTLNNIETATEETSIFEALKKFVNRRVSALPLIDSEGRLKDIYAKFDVINLAAEKTYHNLDVTLKKANEHRNEWFEGVQKCTLDETLFEVMERIVRAEVHRLVVVDEEEKVIGIISLSDLLNYLVLRPTGECNSDLRNELRKKILAERSASIGECSVELHHHEDTKEEIDDPNTSEEKDGSEKELDLLEDESKECENV